MEYGMVGLLGFPIFGKKHRRASTGGTNRVKDFWPLELSRRIFPRIWKTEMLMDVKGNSLT
jgi:hypothetical protein